LFLPVLALAQKDTLSAKERYMPTGIRFGTDAVALARSSFMESFNGWEVSADVDFYRYYLAFEYGKWSRHFTGDNLDYENSGRYWSIGPDVNFLLKDAERNMFFLGLRYARSSFDETFRVIDQNAWGINDRYDNPYINNSVPARWLELTSGIKVHMIKGFWMGFTARFKFGLKTGTTPEMAPHDIPGYGKTNKETTWGFNYQLMYRIPFRKYPPLPPFKKKN
jgi:hypothetical protein